MSGSSSVVYIKGDRNVEITKPEVTLGDILSIECADKTVPPKIRALRLAKIQASGQHRIVVSVLRIIACIHEKYPGLEIQNMGETDIVITYEEQKTPPKILHLIKTVFVIFVTFCGAAFSIMAFNNDVDVTTLFGQIYGFVTGRETDGFTILEITYSIGLTAGILIFFNHFGKKRFTVDPTPMEVQMRLYENDIQTTLIEDSSRKGDELDVGSTDLSGDHRS